VQKHIISFLLFSVSYSFSARTNAAPLACKLKNNEYSHDCVELLNAMVAKKPLIKAFVKPYEDQASVQCSLDPSLTKIVVDSNPGQPTGTLFYACKASSKKNGQGPSSVDVSGEFQVKTDGSVTLEISKTQMFVAE
jgi:hypothetical protein